MNLGPFKQSRLFTDKPRRNAETPVTPGFLRRFAAIFYDSVLLLAIFFLATALILPLNGGEAFTSQHFLLPVYLLSTGFIFYGWFWTHGGQTLGLRAWKIKVISVDDTPVTWKQAFIRFITALLSWTVFGLGFFWVFFNREKLTWHDYFSGTILRFDEQQG